MLCVCSLSTVDMPGQLFMMPTILLVQPPQAVGSELVAGSDCLLLFVVTRLHGGIPEEALEEKVKCWVVASHMSLYL